MMMLRNGGLDCFVLFWNALLDSWTVLFGMFASCGEGSYLGLGHVPTEYSVPKNTTIEKQKSWRNILKD